MSRICRSIFLLSLHRSLLFSSFKGQSTYLILKFNLIALCVPVKRGFDIQTYGQTDGQRPSFFQINYTIVQNTTKDIIQKSTEIQLLQYFISINIVHHLKHPTHQTKKRITYIVTPSHNLGPARWPSNYLREIVSVLETLTLYQLKLDYANCKWPVACTASEIFE